MVLLLTLIAIVLSAVLLLKIMLLANATIDFVNVGEHPSPDYLTASAINKTIVSIYLQDFLKNVRKNQLEAFQTKSKAISGFYSEVKFPIEDTKEIRTKRVNDESKKMESK